MKSTRAEVRAGHRRYFLCRTRARMISEARKDNASQIGGSGMRQLGSSFACQFTTRAEKLSIPEARAAGQCQPVKIAKKPTGTSAPMRGVTIRFEEKPEKETRWKYSAMGRASPICTTVEITASS